GMQIALKKAINPTNETDYALLARNAGFSDVATMGQLLGLSSGYSRGADGLPDGSSARVPPTDKKWRAAIHARRPAGGRRSNLRGEDCTNFFSSRRVTLFSASHTRKGNQDFLNDESSMTTKA
ncbi:hypothetical protein, partial [Trueperella pyogenes]